MKPVVYDCDNTLGVLFSDVDDGLALLYLLGEPETGYLRVSGDGVFGLNLPEVREAEAFRDHIYGTWLSAEISYRSRNYLPLRAVKRVVYPVLRKAAAIYWNLGKMNVKFTGKGVNGHGA